MLQKVYSEKKGQPTENFSGFDSKLTWVLQPVISSRSEICMIIFIYPLQNY